VVQFIQGFQTPYALELLSSVDSIIKERNSFELDVVRKGINEWSTRKKNLFSDKHLLIAINHLNQHANFLYSGN